jgi:hypothetical protein
LLVLPVRGKAAWFVQIEHGDDDQHEEPKGGIVDIGESAGSGVVS